MKSIVVFSSRTGNTQKVANALFEALPEPKDIVAVEADPDIESHDLVVLGYWVDKGTADEKSRTFFEKVKNKSVALFGTLGAEPDSEHADSCRKKVKELLAANTILGDFLCQGKVDPKIIEMMSRMKNDPHHSMTPERQARLKEAEKHPDEKDLEQARAFIAGIVDGIGK